MALTDSGQVFAWGGNEYLQCGVAQEQRDIVSPVLCVPDIKVRGRAGRGCTCAASFRAPGL